MKTALDSMKEQLQYWRDEWGLARQASNAERIARCERYVLQCEHVIAALENAVKIMASENKK